MKRKLNEENVPEEVVEVVEKTTNPQSHVEDNVTRSFIDFQLDPRLLQAIAKEKFTAPTLVQAKAIPLSFEGKDILGNFPHHLFVRQC